MAPLRILLVEDRQDTLRVLSRMLRMAGHDVAPAATAGEALAWAARAGCDLVVSDLGLPDRDGLELMRELGSLYGIPGIAMTGRDDEHLVPACSAAGFRRHLVKPVAFSSLLAAIQDVTHLRAGEENPRSEPPRPR